MRDLGEIAHMLGLGRRGPAPAREYPDVIAGSRAEGRGAGEKGWKERWLATDLHAGEDGLFRRRRDALAHCAPGMQPRLIRVSPGPFPLIVGVGRAAKVVAVRLRAEYERAHEFELVAPRGVDKVVGTAMVR